MSERFLREKFFGAGIPPYHLMIPQSENAGNPLAMPFSRRGDKDHLLLAERNELVRAGNSLVPIRKVFFHEHLLVTGWWLFASST